MDLNKPCRMKLGHHPVVITKGYGDHYLVEAVGKIGVCTSLVGAYGANQLVAYFENVPPEPREFWIEEHSAGDFVVRASRPSGLCEAFPGIYPVSVIHVREVQETS